MKLAPFDEFVVTAMLLICVAAGTVSSAGA